MQYERKEPFARRRHALREKALEARRSYRLEIRPHVRDHRIGRLHLASQAEVRLHRIRKLNPSHQLKHVRGQRRGFAQFQRLASTRLLGGFLHRSQRIDRQAMAANRPLLIPGLRWNHRLET
jgi:hypothetical protein